jgi:hypothetical protein
MRPGAWMTFIAAALAACGTGGDGRPDAFGLGERCTPGGTFHIGGRAAVLGTLNVHVNASLVETDTSAELLIAMDVDQNGTLVAVTAEACAIEIPDVALEGQQEPIRFQVQDSTIASVSEVTGSGVLSSPDQTCATFQTSEFVIVIGARLDEATMATAPLPQADNDGNFTACAPSVDTSCDLAIGVNCACDQEGDGMPGATLLAMNVPVVELDQVYVALRTRFSLAGEVFSSDLVVGEIDAALETSILGCRMKNGDPCNANQVRAVKTLNPVITQQPGNPSLFRAVRVPPGTGCPEIAAMRDTLFPR